MVGFGLWVPGKVPPRAMLFVAFVDAFLSPLFGTFRACTFCGCGAQLCILLATTLVSVSSPAAAACLGLLRTWQ